MIVVSPSLYDVQWLMEVSEAATENFDARTCMSHYFKLSSDFTSQDGMYVDTGLETVINYWSEFTTNIEELKQRPLLFCSGIHYWFQYRKIRDFLLMESPRIRRNKIRYSVLIARSNRESKEYIRLLFGWRSIWEKYANFNFCWFCDFDVPCISTEFALGN